MGPFLSIIIAAFLATLSLDVHRMPDDVDRATATMLALGMIGSAWVTSRVNRASGAGPLRQPRWARPMDLALYGLLLYGTDWIAVAREATGDLPFFRHLLLLAPYVLAALARVDAAWPAEGTEQHPWSRGRAVVFHARLLLIPILPLLVINGIHDLLRKIEPVRILLDSYPVLDYGLMSSLLVIATLFMPVILTWILQTKPLPPGPLRDVLEADLARQRVKIGDIEQVDTGGFVANAAYLGIALRTSRVFITDALLRAMPADELRAVFAHEIAHGTRRHLVWFVALFVGLVLSTYLIGDVVPPEWAMVAIPFVFILGIVAFVVISRRFEVEADLVAAETIGDPGAFNRALTRVGVMAGKPLERHGVRHFAIGTRTAIVDACATDPRARSFWRRKIFSAKLAIGAVFLLIVAGVVWKVPADIQVSRAFADVVAAQKLRDQEVDALRGGVVRSPAEAAAVAQSIEQHLQRALVRARKELAHPAVRARAAAVGVAALMAFADEALREGDFVAARHLAAEIEADWPRGDSIGDFNRQWLAVELAAIDPSRDLATLREQVKQSHEAILELLKTYPADRSSDEVLKEIRFLLAASGADGAGLEYEPDTFESARLLALLARGAPLQGSDLTEARRALETWERNDPAWRRAVLERRLGGSPREVMKGLVAETRRGV